jgi:uncharacterized protein
MRDDQIRQLLRERNPWWTAGVRHSDPTEWARHDSTLLAAESSTITYDPAVVADLAPPMLLVLRGPRRVGKSVAAKRLIEDLCRNGGVEQANRTIYFSVDGWRAQDLRRAFTMGVELTPLSTGPRTWIVDEISAVDGWQDIIKELRDNTPIAHDALLVTGSSARDLGDARTALAGRTRATNPFRLLLPMSFREYIDACAPGSIGRPPTLTPDLLQTPAAADVVRSLSPLIGDLDLAWQRYLEVGGFPRAVSDSRAIGAVSDEFVNDLLGWLAGEIEPDGPMESIPELLAAIGRRLSSPLDVSGLAEDVRSTRRRISVRLDRMSRGLAAVWCRQADDDGRDVPGAASKLYLIDPLLARLPALSDPSFALPDATKLNELVVGMELAKAIHRIHQDRLVEQRSIRYLRTGGGREVDFGPVRIRVGGHEVATSPIESKWVSANWRSESLVMRGRFHRGIVATKDIVDLSDEVWAIPSPIVALLLN